MTQLLIDRATLEQFVGALEAVLDDSKYANELTVTGGVYEGLQCKEALTAGRAALRCGSLEDRRSIRSTQMTTLPKEAMTAERAAFFLQRFKNDEKMLGPNEQAAIDFALASLVQHSAPRIRAMFECIGSRVVGSTEAPIKRVDHEDDDSFTVVIDHWPDMGPATAAPAPQVQECTRSHPHELMDGYCGLRTEIARLTNEKAREE